MRTCCSKHQAHLTLSEAQAISAKLEISWERFLAEYTDPRWPGTNSFLLRHADGACIFLKRSENGDHTLCQIHSFKPSCCLEWIAGPQHPECLEDCATYNSAEIDLKL